MTTLEQIILKDKERMIRSINLAIFLKPGHRQEAEEIFDSAVTILYTLYPKLLKLDREDLCRALWGIIRKKILIWKRQQWDKEQFSKYGELPSYKHRIESNRKRNLARFHEIMANPILYREYKEKSKVLKRDLRKRKKNGVFKDMRFRENNPRDNTRTMLWES